MARLSIHDPAWKLNMGLQRGKHLLRGVGNTWLVVVQEVGGGEQALRRLRALG